MNRFPTVMLWVLLLGGPVLLGAGCTNGATPGETAPQPQEQPQPTTPTDTPREDTPTTTTSTTSVDAQTRATAVAAFDRQLQSVDELVATFDANMEANPDMLTQEQQQTWEDAQDTLSSTRQDAASALEQLMQAPEEQWMDRAQQTRRAIQTYAEQYVEAKLSILGISEAEVQAELQGQTTP